MNLYDRIQYLANISILLEAQEKMGLQRSSRLAAEFQRNWNELKKDLGDETRKSADGSSGAQAESASAWGEPRRSGPTGPEGWDTPSGGTIVQG